MAPCALIGTNSGITYGCASSAGINNCLFCADKSQRWRASQLTINEALVCLSTRSRTELKLNRIPTRIVLYRHSRAELCEETTCEWVFTVD